jgi:FkbM family methyltransferase
MISYSQNFEDVILNRALGHIQAGHYIDLGAFDPVFHSTTKWFYDLGWRGLNVEPVTSYYQKLLENRKDDINLNCFIGDSNGEIVFYEVQDSGLSTGLDSYAKYATEIGLSVEKRSIQSMSPFEMMKHYPWTEIHFLKIDVEGGEKIILENFDFRKWQPWIVLVESFLPNSRVESHTEWEHYLINSDYVHAYSDGLNRYYIPKSRLNLLTFFNYPPNVFDNFVLHTTLAGLNPLENLRNSAELELLEIKTSTTWRLTYPLRLLFRFVKFATRLGRPRS